MAGPREKERPVTKIGKGFVDDDESNESFLEVLVVCFCNCSNCYRGLA